LQNVFGILTILRNMLSQTENLAFVTAHEFIERSGVVSARLRYQLRFVDAGETGYCHVSPVLSIIPRDGHVTPYPIG
jgi:hypothetical protein